MNKPDGYLLIRGQDNSEYCWAQGPIKPCLLSNSIVTNLENLATKKAAEKGLKIVGLKLHTHTKPMTIEVKIENLAHQDISLEDCAIFSQPMSEAIDESKLLNDSYVLEISSPGLSNFLKTDREFKTFKGFPIEVRFKNKENSKLSQSGLLHERSNEYLLLNIKGKMSKIPRKDIINVELTSLTG